MQKYLIVLLLATYSCSLFAQPKKEPAQAYNYASQKKYLPEAITNVFLGMRWGQFRKAMKLDDLEFDKGYNQVASFKKYYPLDDNFENIASITYYFPASDSTYDTSGMNDDARMYKMVVEFSRYDDRDVFLVGWRKIKDLKVISYYDWTFSTGGLTCRVQAGGFNITYVGKVPDTPWQGDVAQMDGNK